MRVPLHSTRALLRHWSELVLVYVLSFSSYLPLTLRSSQPHIPSVKTPIPDPSLHKSHTNTLPHLETPNLIPTPGIRPIRRLPLRPPHLRTTQRSQLQRPLQPNRRPPTSLLQPILRQRRLCRSSQHRPLQPHRTHPHPSSNPTPRRRTPLHRPSRLHPQAIRPRRYLGRSLPRYSGYLAT